MNIVTRGFARGLARIARWITRSAWFPAMPVGHWGPDWFQRGYPSPSSMPPLLTFPAVFTAIDGISNDIARLPMRHFRREAGEVLEVENSAALRVLEEPNGYQTRFDFMKQLVASQLYRGNGYAYAIRNRRYEVDELHNLWPDSVWPYRAGTEVFYEVGANPLGGINSARMLTTRECFHHRMMTLNDPIFGVTPLVSAALSCSAGMAILRQSERFFNSMSRPSGVLQTAGRLNADQAQAIKDRWNSVYKGPENAGEVAVLEQGLEWKPLTMTSVDAQLIEQLRYTVEDVARVYQLPLFKLGDYTKVSYSSTEQLTRIYHSQCLAAHMESLEDRFTWFFGMNPRQEWLEFDTDALFRTEMVQRIDSLAKSVQGGIRTPNEARKSEGLNPIEGGDTVYMQAQMTPLTILEAKSAAPQPIPPAPPTTAVLPAPAPAAVEIDVAALSDELMSEVFRDDQPRRRRRPHLALVESGEPEQKLIYGRRSRPAA
jgi:HK97 family phage portal protein